MDTRKNFEDVCLSLNMDRETADSAWRLYQKIDEDYGLEGDGLHWLACSLYASGQQSSHETVGGHHVTGNKVSLTQILRKTDLSLIDFFKKIKRWAEMAKMDPDFQEKIDSLERKFEVVSVIFQKYLKVFCDVFAKPEPTAKMTRHRAARKPQRNKLCTSYEVFSFGWTLYVHIKGKYPAIADDLVNSHHLLLCCVDTLYTSVVSLGSRQDLLNDTFIVPQDPPTNYVLQELCRRHNGIEKECKVIKDYHWRKSLYSLFNEKKEYGGVDVVTSVITDHESLALLLDKRHFCANDKYINREYDQYILGEGEFDERIFISENAPSEIGTPRATFGFLATSYESSPQHLKPQTPLSGKQYLPNKEYRDLTPVANAAHSVTHLHHMLEENKPEASPYIASLCDITCIDNLQSKITALSSKFLSAFNQNDDDDVDGCKFAQHRLKLAVTLFYKLLESTIRDEEKRLGDCALLKKMLEHDFFITSLFACSVEIVLKSYDSQKVFPWVLTVLDLSAYHFYKVIEVIIKVEGSLSRGIIKHLNKIEAMVLGSLAWRSDSPLFDAIEAKGSVPCYEEVSIPIGSPEATKIASPFIHPRLKSLGAKDGSQSPLSAHDRYASPVPPNARRQLFSNPTSNASPVKYIPIAPKPSIVTVMPLESNPATTLTTELLSSPTRKDGYVVPPVVQVAAGSPAKSLSTVETVSAGCKARRGGSLELFYRKVFQMAYLRVKDLCERLGITDTNDHIQKIWTTLEHSMVKNPDMLRDRDIDQLIMCAIYVMSKVLKLQVTFQEIMKQYRHQPQARNHVYRSVLLNNGSRKAVLESGNISSASMKPTAEPVAEYDPDFTEGRTLNRKDVALGQRGDIIEFYNKIYITYIKDFALKFQPAEENGSSPALSPMPVVKKSQPSPRKVSNNIFISPHKPVLAPSPLTKTYEYQFDKSPSKDLSKINEVVNNAARMGTKRKLDYTSSVLSPPSPKQMTLMVPRPPTSKMMQIVQKMSQERQDANRNYLSTTTTPQ